MRLDLALKNHFKAHFSICWAAFVVQFAIANSFCNSPFQKSKRGRYPALFDRMPASRFYVLG
jgi:hypothetical protein